VLNVLKVSESGGKISAAQIWATKFACVLNTPDCHRPTGK
jgi:hypothetical protein